MNILIFGSSITWGAWDKNGGWAQRLKSFTDAKARELNFKNYTAVYPLGVSGNTTNGLLQRFDTEVKARVDGGEETLIVIEIGMNDSLFLLAENKHLVPPEEYRKNLITLIERSKKYGARLIFVGLTPVDKRVDPIPWLSSGAYRLEFVKKYEDILKEVCEEGKVDFVEVMSKFPAKDYATLLTDGVHPSTEGHRIIFEEVKRYLMDKGLI